MARGRRAPAPPRYDPLAPLAPKQLRRQVTQDVRAQTIPLARELTRQINAQAAAGAANIAGVSSQLATQLGGAQGVQRDIYERARASLGGAAAEGAGQFGTAAGGLADSLRARLASAGAPSTLADSLATSLQGAQAAGAGRQGATLDELTQNQAGAESYGAKLPDLARLSGLQGIKDRQAQAQQDLAKELGALNARTPGLIAQETEAARNLEYQKGVARLGFQGDVYKTQASAQQNQARIRAENQRAQLSHQDRQASIAAANKRSGQSLAERARHNGISEREQATRDQASASLRRQSNRQRAQSQAETKRHHKATEKIQSKKAKSGGSVTGLGK